MARCEFCGKTVSLPYRCNYCGKFFCDEHRLPPKHNCPYIDQWRRKEPPTRAELEPLTIPTYPDVRATDSGWVPVNVKKSRTIGRRVKKRRRNPLKLITAIILLLALSYIYADTNFSDQSFDDIGGNGIDSFLNLSISLAPTPVDLREKLWRYDLKYALEVALSASELNKIENLANMLRGGDLKESAWNVLEWVDENIEYDHIKAIKPNPTIIYYYDGDIITDVKISASNDTYIQTPYETIEKGKGICTDYAILTAGLLLAMGYSPVYIFDINFENSNVGHAAAAIKVNNQYFILDQHLPIWDLGRYYRHNAEEGKVIKNATVYAIYRGGQYATVKKVQKLDADTFSKNTYHVTQSDLKKLQTALSNEFKAKYRLIEDYSIRNLDSWRYLPRSYSYGVSWTLRYDEVYYHPLFQKSLARYIINGLDGGILKDIKKSNRFWIRVRHEGGEIVITLLLAKK